MADALIRVCDLTCAYDDENTILEHINFEVATNDIFIILGRSGCGKTTLFNHMIGLFKPVTGDILLENESMVTATEKQKPTLLRKIGVMYQGGALFSSMNLLDNIRLPLEEFTLLPKEAIDEIAHNKLAMVGLSDYGDSEPSEISGGMRKRAALARAMALDPKVLFLDEPSAGLDPITSSQLDELILQLSRTLGVTLVIVTHELDSINKIANQVIFLNDKKIIASGSPDELKNHCDQAIVNQFFHRQAK